MTGVAGSFGDVEAHQGLDRKVSYDYGHDHG
jgi:hypothetical protein